MFSSRSTVTVGALLTASVILSGCSTKAASSQGASSSDGVKTDIGVTDTEISLGVLTDNSGPLKTGGLLITSGNQIWADKVNAAGGVCGRKIKLDIRDSAYKAENAFPLYEQMNTQDLGLLQLLGSAIVASLKEKLSNDNIVAIPAGWSSINLDSPSMVYVGSTYDVDAINALAYLDEQGVVGDGDSIGVIYLDSEAGQNVLLGAQYYGKQHGMTVIEAPVSPTDTDMTATVTKMKSEGVKAIVMLTSPNALASVAIQNEAQKLNVPIVAMSSTFTPTLLEDASVTEALKGTIVAQPFLPLSSNEPIVTEVLEAYKATGTTDPPGQFIFAGYAAGLAWQQILEAACEAGDLTRAGVMKVRSELTDVDTQGLTGNLDLSKPGAPPTRETVLERPNASVIGSVELIEAAYQSTDAQEYKAPYEK